MKNSAYLVFVTVVAMAIAGCNTMKGFGKDVERGGEHVQDAAQKTQNKM